MHYFENTLFEKVYRFGHITAMTHLLQLIPLHKNNYILQIINSIDSDI